MNKKLNVRMCWFADWVTLLSARCKYKLINVCTVSQARQELCRDPGVLRHVVHGNDIPEYVQPVRQKPFLTTRLITIFSFLFHPRLI